MFASSLVLKKSVNKMVFFGGWRLLLEKGGSATPTSKTGGTTKPQEKAPLLFTSIVIS